MRHKVRVVTIERCQIGWRCEVTYAVATTRQFADETHCVVAGGRWMWLALWRGIAAARKDAATVAAKPGERETNGWVD